MKKKKQVTLTGESIEIVERLCEITGLTPRHVVALLLRKYGRELESWIGGDSTRSFHDGPSTSSPLAPTSEPTPHSTDFKPVPQTPNLPPPPSNSHNEEASLDLPQDPGMGLKPIQL